MLKINSTSNNKITVTMNLSDEIIRLANKPSETEFTRFNFSKKLDKCGKSYNNQFCFYSWLTGYIDGDGCFNIYTNEKNNKITFTFKLGQKENNKQVLYYIKKELKAGSVIIDNKGMANFLIRKKKEIKDIVIPLFKKYNLLTSKEFKFLLFEESFYIYLDKDLTQIEKINKINKIKEIEIPYNYISKKLLDINLIINKSWVVGFIEAEGSFYITIKEEKRLVHGFGLTQKLDKIILEKIKLILKINSNVRYNINGFYSLDCYNKNSLKYIKKFFFKTMKSRKALIYRIWARSFRLKGKYDKLLKIQEKIRKLY